MENTYWNKDLKFTLTIEDGSLILPENPIGWDDSFIKIERSTEFFGLFRSYCQPLTFVKSGAHLLRSVFYNKTGRVGAECTMTVEKYNRMTMLYETLFTGKVDFSTFNDSEDGVKVTIADNGLSKWIKLNKDTKYSIFLEENMQMPAPGGIVAYMPVRRLIRELVDKMTEGRVTSGEFDVDTGFVEDDLLGLTSGFAIRVPGGSTYLISISFSDVMKDLMTYFSAGCSTYFDGSVEVFLFNTLNIVYNSVSEIYDLGDVAEFSLMIDEEKPFSTVIAGQKDSDIDRELNPWEINCQSTFNILNTDVKGEFNLKINNRADWAGIKKLFGSDDTQFDEDLFFLDLTTGTTPPLFYPQLHASEVTQDITPSQWYNHIFSPRHIIKNNSKLINSKLDGRQGDNLTFVSSAVYNEFNVSKYMDDSDTSLAENATLEITMDKLYNPYLFNFKCPANYEFLKAFMANPLGYISFTWNNHSYKGFAQDMSINIAERTTIEFNLLCHPGVNLLPLIRR